MAVTFDVFVRLLELALGAAGGLLVLPALAQRLKRRLQQNAPAATERLFMRLVVTDTIFAGVGVINNVLLVAMDGDGSSSVMDAVNALFLATFVASLLALPILSAFVLSNGHRSFPVRTCWCASWLLGVGYGLVWLTHTQPSNVTNNYASTLVYCLALLFFLSMAMVLTAVAFVYAQKWGYWGPVKAVVQQERLMRYLVLVLCVQLPFMVVCWLGREALQTSSGRATLCIIYLVPIMNAVVLGRQPTCYRVVGGAGDNVVTQILATGSDATSLKELQGLTNVVFIAEGASGSVFKATWLGIDVAVKVLKLPEYGQDKDLYQTIIEQSQESFIAEASMFSRLRHPNITLFIRAGYYEGKLGIVTEYCARGSLKDVLKKHYPLPWRRKVTMALHIAKGLTYLHARNPTYIHRDLKASNILVTDTWQAKLADFGISKVVSTYVNRVGTTSDQIQQPFSFPTAQTIFNEDTSFAGTWRWNAPEILQDPQNCRYNRATDMYSFGMVLWEIVSDGAIPFQDVKFDFEVRDRVLMEERPPILPTQKCPEMFSNLITQCWAHDPSQRPTAVQASDILNALSETLEKANERHLDSSAEISASSIFSSLRGSLLTGRSGRGSMQSVRNFFRGKFSVTGSNRSGYHEDSFLPSYTSSIASSTDASSPENNSSRSNFSNSGASFASRKRALSRGGSRLASLNEYDHLESPASVLTTPSPVEAIMSPIMEFPVDAILENNTIYDVMGGDSGRGRTSYVTESKPQQQHLIRLFEPDTRTDAADFIMQTNSGTADRNDLEGGELLSSGKRQQAQANATTPDSPVMHGMFAYL